MREVLGVRACDIKQLPQSHAMLRVVGHLLALYTAPKANRSPSNKTLEGMSMRVCDRMQAPKSHAMIREFVSFLVYTQHFKHLVVPVTRRAKCLAYLRACDSKQSPLSYAMPRKFECFCSSEVGVSSSSDTQNGDEGNQYFWLYKFGFMHLAAAGLEIQRSVNLASRS